VEKLKQLLACVVDTIVVKGRNHIEPYYFVPGVLRGSLGRPYCGPLNAVAELAGFNTVPLLTRFRRSRA